MDLYVIFSVQVLSSTYCKKSQKYNYIKKKSFKLILTYFPPFYRLIGKPPFNGKTYNEVLAQNRAGIVKLDGPEFLRVPNMGKNNKLNTIFNIVYKLKFFPKNQPMIY